MKHIGQYKVSFFFFFFLTQYFFFDKVTFLKTYLENQHRLVNVLFTNCFELKTRYVQQRSKLFFYYLRKSHLQKAYFVGPGERVKPRLSQALTRGARPDSNSRPAVQISSPLPSRYAHWGRSKPIYKQPKFIYKLK